MATTRIPIPAWAKVQKSDNRLDLSLAEIGITVRTVNCLEDAGLFTVHDLLDSTPEELLKISNVGEKTLKSIYAALERIGFHRASRTTSEQRKLRVVCIDQ